VTCDLSLNTDSHTGFFRTTAVRLCPPKCNERCTRVLHFLPLRSYACVLIPLFSVVFHPTRAVPNLDLRFFRTEYITTDGQWNVTRAVISNSYPSFWHEHKQVFQGQSCSLQSIAVDTDSCTVYLTWWPLRQWNMPVEQIITSLCRYLTLSSVNEENAFLVFELISCHCLVRLAPFLTKWVYVYCNCRH
jgi:hypothetical protein